MILIWGYLNFNNYGDELLADIIEKKLGAQETQKLSKKNSLIEHLALVSKARTIIGFGGMFQDASSILSPIYYFLVITLAKLTGTKVILVAHGIGPLYSPSSKILSYIAFRLADYISVRDHSSSDLLHKLKIPHEYFSDLVWALVEDGSPRPCGARDDVVISLREDPRKHDMAIIYDLVLQMLEDYPGKPILFISMQDSDIKIHKELKALIKNHTITEIKASDYQATELVDILRTQCSSIIAMRLHALILGHMAGLELRAISCDPKIEELQMQIHEYDLLTLNSRAEQALEAMIDKI